MELSRKSGPVAVAGRIGPLRVAKVKRVEKRAKNGQKSSFGES